MACNRGSAGLAKSSSTEVELIASSDGLRLLDQNEVPRDNEAALDLNSDPMLNSHWQRHLAPDRKMETTDVRES